MVLRACAVLSLLIGSPQVASGQTTARLERLEYRHPGLEVDLGVGLYGYPLPLDGDGDGDLDLLVSCPDRPFNGTYLFLNPGEKDPKFSVFEPGRKLGPGLRQPTLSWVADQPRLLVANIEYPRFQEGDFTTKREIYPQDRVAEINHLRGNTWRFADFDGDGVSDLLVGHGSWDDFGSFGTNDWWKHYDAHGEYHGELLKGWVFWIRNEGTDAAPRWAEPEQLAAGEEVIETIGWPVPNLADFDGDGDFDLICGEFLDQITWFENIGSRTAPEFARGRRLLHEGRPLAMDLQMIFPQAADWDGDGDTDLLVGDEDGRVALVENSGQKQEGMPAFQPPYYFRQQAKYVKFGALATPVGCDWDGDGDIDLIAGNTAGHVGFIENLSGPGVERPRFAEPELLAAEGKTIRIQAGPSGSIQGPIEAKWGYTVPSVADWNHDGLPDVLLNSIWGKIVWHENIGTREQPVLAAARPVEVDWPGQVPKPEWNWWNPHGQELVTQWRTTPLAVDWNEDGLTDLVMLDHEGYLAFYERNQSDEALALSPPRRVFTDAQGEPLRLNAGSGGRSGRRKICLADWDGDGRRDLLVDSQNANLWRQLEPRDGKYRFQDLGPLAEDNIASHSVSPTVVDWNGDGVPDFLGGAEDGHFYYLRNPRNKAPSP